MKVNLLIHSNAVRSGFTNVDPLASPGSPDRVQGSVTNLDEIVEDAEATELVALDVIDYVPAPDVPGVIAGWVRKLRHGGQITIGGVDLRDVAKAVVFQQLSPNEAAGLLYGEQVAPWDYRKGTYTIQHVINILLGHGLQIMLKESDRFHYYVTARRP